MISKTRPHLFSSLKDEHAQILLEFFSEAGVEVIDTTTDDAKVILFNSNKHSHVQFSIADETDYQIIPELKCLEGSTIANKTVLSLFFGGTRFNHTVRAISPPLPPHL